MTNQQREALIDRILALEPDLLRARFCAQPPELLHMDVTVPQLKTLMALFLAPDAETSSGLRVSDLARALAVTPATASALVDRLVERGLVERREDPQDRRQRRCRVSPAGQELLTGFFEAARSQTRAMLAVLGEAELGVVLRSLEILIDAADRLRAMGSSTSGAPMTYPPPQPSPARGEGNSLRPSRVPTA